MTLKELYDAVAQLGFEAELENDNRFLHAVNRALIQVNRIRPATSIYKLNHFPIKNLLTGNTFEPKCKDDEALIFVVEKAKSYYFECNGNGQVIFENSTDSGKTWAVVDTVELSSPDGGFTAYRGFIKNGTEFCSGLVRLKFSGEFIYYIQNVALYEHVLSENVSDIPAFGEYCTYNIASLVSDFLSFACPPIVDAKRVEGFILDKDYFVEGVGKILIPSSIIDTFEVRYNRKIAAVPLESVEMETITIDLDDELCAILPNLIASYVWVEDEPDKANYYLNLYREQVAEIKQESKSFAPLVYRNKSRW